jgi:aminobenzoyl-glutamate transport protein
MPASTEVSRSWFSRFLGGVERVGNALPQPATLFALLAIATLLLSGRLRRWAFKSPIPPTAKRWRR